MRPTLTTRPLPPSRQTGVRVAYSPVRWRPRLPTVARDPDLYLFILVVVGLFWLAHLFVSGLRPVTLRVNETTTILMTRQDTVRGVLSEAGIKLDEGDTVTPTLEENLPADGMIVIREAQPVLVQVDGDTLMRRTQSLTIEALLRESNVQVKPFDRVFLDGRPVSLSSPLPRPATNLGRPAIPANAPALPRVEIQRAVPITLEEDGGRTVIYTTEPTLGQALQSAGILIYQGDTVSPNLAEPATAGRTVYLKRSVPVSIQVDNRTIRTRTQEHSVSALLAQEGIELVGKDFANVSLQAPVQANLAVNITRVREVFETESEYLPFQTKWLPNADLEIDQRITAQAGLQGIKKRTIKTVFENGRQISRGIDREWIERPPQDLIYNYGTKIVERPLTLPDGRRVTYWRVIRVFATSYTAATSGKRPDHPQYGITFTGLRSGKGIVAVDPKLIRLGSQLYVPGYGQAVAGDTGGRILGRRIDLGYSEDDLVMWFDWVDVYLLSPAPPRTQINYLLPDLPRTRVYLP